MGEFEGRTRDNGNERIYAMRCIVRGGAAGKGEELIDDELVGDQLVTSW